MKNLRNKNYPASGDIQDRLETAWDKVVAIYAQLEYVIALGTALDGGELANLVHTTDIDTLAELNALVGDATLTDIAAQATATQGALADTAVQPSDVNSLAALNAFISESLATEGYVGTQIASAISAMFEYKGAYDANTNTPDLDTAPSGVSQADVYVVSVAGTFFTIPVEVGDMLIAEVDSANLETHWTVVNRNIDSAAFATAAQGALADTATQPGDNISTLVNDAGYTDDQTGAEIKTAYELQADTNAFTDAEKTKLAGVEGGATADQSDAEIEGAYNNQVTQVSAGEKTAGTEVLVRRFSPKDVADMAGTHGSGGGGGMTAVVKATSYTAAAGEIVLVESDKGTYTITLPVTPSGGDRVSIWDCGDNAGVNTITIDRNGSTINGVASDYLLNADGGRVDFTYDTTNATWEYSYITNTVQPSQTVQDYLHESVYAGQVGYGNGAALETYDFTSWIKLIDGIANYAQYRTRIPEDWDGTFAIRHNWCPDSTNTGAITLLAIFECVAAGETVTSPTGSGVALTTSTPPGVAYELVDEGWQEFDLVALQSAVVGEFLRISLYRDGLADAFTGNILIPRIETRFGRTKTLKALTAIGNTTSAVYNTQVGTTYTLQATDNGKIVLFTNGSAIAVTLPDGLDVNFQCTILQAGAGVPTVTPSGADTVNGAGTGVAPSAQWNAMYLSKYDTGIWVAVT